MWPQLLHSAPSAAEPLGSVDNVELAAWHWRSGCWSSGDVRQVPRRAALAPLRQYACRTIAIGLSVSKSYSAAMRSVPISRLGTCNCRWMQGRFPLLIRPDLPEADSWTIFAVSGYQPLVANQPSAQPHRLISSGLPGIRHPGVNLAAASPRIASQSSDVGAVKLEKPRPTITRNAALA